MVDKKKKHGFRLLGYFSIAMKNLFLSDTVSKTTIKKIQGLGCEKKELSAILIGQLGKNSNYEKDIDGKTLIANAMSVVYEVKKMIGGRIVFVECQDVPSLIKFYGKNGFDFLQKEKGLCQLIRYIK